MTRGYFDMLDRLTKELEESDNFDKKLKDKYLGEAGYIIKKCYYLFRWYCLSRGVEPSEIDTVRNMSFDFTPELRDEMQRSFSLLNDNGREGYWEWIWQCIVEKQLDQLKPDNLRKMRRDRPTPSF